MSRFPKVEIAADRLVLRAYRPEDLERVRALLMGDERTALPPGSPSDPQDLPEVAGRRAR